MFWVLFHQILIGMNGLRHCRGPWLQGLWKQTRICKKEVSINLICVIMFISIVIWYNRSTRSFKWWKKVGKAGFRWNTILESLKGIQRIVCIICKAFIIMPLIWWQDRCIKTLLTKWLECLCCDNPYKISKLLLTLSSKRFYEMPV